jgi:hypothetical protein
MIKMKCDDCGDYFGDGDTLFCQKCRNLLDDKIVSLEDENIELKKENSELRKQVDSK